MPVFARPADAGSRCAWRKLVVVSIVAALLTPPAAIAEEYSTVSTSTVLGRNTGIPTGVADAHASRTQSTRAVGRVDLVVESAFYFKNMELFGLDVVEGETLFGFLLPLRFRFQAHERLRIELGALLGEDFGDDNRLNVAEPLVRLAYSAADDVHVIAGTLYPTHWIHDALIDDTNKLRGRAEQGVQFRVDGDRLKQDLWINWHIRETSVRAEEFEIASSSQVRLMEDLLRLDAQALWSHAGGQISVDERLEHNLTFMTGASVGGGIGCWGVCVEQLRVAGRFFYSIKSGRGIDRDTGNGWETALSARMPLGESAHGTIHASYFEGNDLLQERGDPLYRIDRYAQLGGSLLFRPLPGLGIETGILGQWTDDELNFTYTVNFVWGQAFATPLRRPAAD